MFPIFYPHTLAKSSIWHSGRNSVFVEGQHKLYVTTVHAWLFEFTHSQPSFFFGRTFANKESEQRFSSFVHFLFSWAWELASPLFFRGVGVSRVKLAVYPFRMTGEPIPSLPFLPKQAWCLSTFVHLWLCVSLHSHCPWLYLSYRWCQSQIPGIDWTRRIVHKHAKLIRPR